MGLIQTSSLKDGAMMTIKRRLPFKIWVCMSIKAGRIVPPCTYTWWAFLAWSWAAGATWTILPSCTRTACLGAVEEQVSTDQQGSRMIAFLRTGAAGGGL